MTQGVSNGAGFKAWFNFLRKECKQNFISSVIIAFKNRSVVPNEKSQTLMHQQSWYGTSLKGTLMERSMTLQEWDKEYSLKPPAQEAAPEPHSQSPTSPQAGNSPDEIRSGGEPTQNTSPADRLEHKLRHECTSQKQLKKHIKEAQAAGMAGDDIKAMVDTERTMALCTNCMRYLADREDHQTLTSLINRTYAGFGGNMTLPLSQAMKSQKTMTPCEKFHADAYLKMNKNDRSQAVIDVRDKLTIWKLNPEKIDNHPLIAQITPGKIN